jgi:integrase
MATRARRKWKPDSRGYYNRSIGWEQSKSGKIQQHKFILGTDLREAEKRERKLRELWDAYAVGCDEDRPFWMDDLMAIAKRIAKGVPDVPIPRGPQEKLYQYAERIKRIQAKYPVILFKPEDEHAYEVGLAALEMFESNPIPDDLILNPKDIATLDPEIHKVWAEAKAKLKEAGLGFEPELIAVPSLVADGSPSAPLFGRMRPSDPSLKKLHEDPQIDVCEGEAEPIRSALDEGNLQLFSTTLHQAFDAYQEYIIRECYLSEEGHVSAWGNAQVGQINTLKRHHEDRLLTTLSGSVVDEMIGHWRRRPCKTGSNQPVTAKTARNYMSTLIRFFKWLHKSSKFEWSKPFAFSDLNKRVRRLPEDHAKKSLEQVDTFSLEELQLLMRYGRPLDRLLILLSLNCGYGRAEIASLRIGEIHLNKGHTKREQELLGYKTTNKDSFIKRVRIKNGVYGEHLLFPMTVEGIQWAMERQKQQPDCSREARLLLDRNGKPLDQPTAKGNFNHTVPNHLVRLIKRIQDDGHSIRPLSFGKLRKTASQLLKLHSDGEVMGVFDFHGQPVKSDALTDAYSNRPFGRVFQAIRDVQEYLTPVFEEAGPSPFEPQAQAYAKRSKIDRIVELH